MKRTLLILVLALTATLNVFSQTATAPSAGDGTEGNPYQIATLNNLYWIAASSANWDKSYIQTADIDASATATWISGAGWEPIGNGTVHFTGSYNGQNHNISNLLINKPNYDYVGFFAFTQDATISNMILINFIHKGSNHSGGLAGAIWGGTISNCSTSGTASASAAVDAYSGGFAGYIWGGIISNCSSSGLASASASGADGYASSGGFAGYINGVTISNCSSSGTATSSGISFAYSGGFAGFIDAGTISNCSSSGVASSSAFTSSSGGFAGYIDAGTISYCSSSGVASSSTESFAIAYSGGFAGYIDAGTISYCYTFGQVLASGAAISRGGFAGSNSATISNSYWCTDVYPTSEGGTGLTSNQMRNKNSFDGWDFTNIWKMSSTSSIENHGFPILQWMDSGAYGEIALKGNEQVIAIGDATPSVADFTDFGEAVSNSETITRTFEITNTAAADLNLNGASPYVSISGVNFSEFSITKIPSTTITQNGNTTFRVAFSPTGAATGVRSATITIANNDADEGAYTIGIQGTGVSAPNIQSNNIYFSNISRTGMTVNWSRGNGDKCVLLGREAYNIASAPLTNGLSYSNASASYTDGLNSSISGAKVLYNGNAANPSVGITNLTKYKLYYFKVAEYNEVRENEDKITLYQQASANRNPASRWTLRKDGEESSVNSEFVYPNPATNEINYDVYIPETSDVRLEIYSTGSKLIKNINFGRYPEGAAKITADIAEVTSGAYLLVYHIGEESFVALIDIVK